METIEESVVMAMDGAESNLFPYLPYIMQDLWEIGSSPEIIIELLRKHVNDFSKIKILDLGCGKGAVSIKIAKEFSCHCYGIDAIKEFIGEAQNKSKEYNVEKHCHFEFGDIRTTISNFTDYSIIILGAIGPVFGDYYSTLSILTKCLKQNGLIVIDDGYIEDGNNYSHPLMEKKSQILKQISDVGMNLLDEVIIDQDEIKTSDEYILDKIKKRCQELIKKHPDKSSLFYNYIKKQEEENEVLENKVTCSTMLIGKVI